MIVHAGAQSNASAAGKVACAVVRAAYTGCARKSGRTNVEKFLMWMGVLGALALGGCATRPAGEASPSAAQTGTAALQQAPLRVTLVLRDGSKVTGQPALAALPLRTDYTKVDMPLAKILAVKFSADARNAVVSLANGDKLSAVPGLAELKVTTVYGKVVIPLKLIASLTVSAGGTSAAARDGLILWFPFDGVTGPDVADASGHGHTGQLFAGARIVADAGRRRDVLELERRGAHVRVPGSPDFALTNLTFTVWLKPAEWSCQPNASHVILSTVTMDSFDGWEFFIGGPHQICWHCRLPEDRQELSTPATLDFENDADWHFVAFTFAYQEGHYAVTTYCDGKPLKQEEHAANAMGCSGQIMHIGINYDSPAAGLGHNNRREYHGRMDDLMLFNCALDEQKIAALYRAQR